MEEAFVQEDKEEGSIAMENKESVGMATNCSTEYKEEKLSLSSNAKLFSTNSNLPLAQEIAACLGTKLGDLTVDRFSDGEIHVEMNETVRGCDVFIVAPTCPPVNDNLMELLLVADACKRASAGRIFAVMSYYGYARQDRKAKPREPIAAKLVADMLTVSGLSGLLTMDLHARQIQGFYDIPVDLMSAMSILANHYRERHFTGSDLVVVSPDLGSVARARNVAKRLDAPIAIIDKRRPKPNMSEVMNIIGDVAGKRAIIIDDLIDTGGTFINAAKALQEKGAKEIYACATHAILSGDCIERLQNSPIKELVVTNTVMLPPEKKVPMLRTLSVAHKLARGIDSICQDEPMSEIE